MAWWDRARDRSQITAYSSALHWRARFPLSGSWSLAFTLMAMHARHVPPTLPPKQMLETRSSAAEALQPSARGGSSRSSGSEGAALPYLPFLYAFKLLLFWKRSQGVETAAATWQRHLSAQGRLQVSGKYRSKHDCQTHTIQGHPYFVVYRTCSMLG